MAAPKFKVGQVLKHHESNYTRIVLDVTETEYVLQAARDPEDNLICRPWAASFPTRHSYVEKYYVAAESQPEAELNDNLDPQSRYYDAGGIETLDIIKAKLTHEQYIGYLLGNIIKYSSRFNFKHAGIGRIRDAQKMLMYSKNLTALLEEN